ncbi:hypothetical protein [Arcobacter cloacae]|uniref:Uncharacterized protein n=2 Tax=Arcobacter TaxID=28196 RepID=A0A6M8NGF7_9BACT|nr:hypothetical protein [Arcobacter cloacae]QKF90405.1 putative membrane protein [Arcobacter cloacae]RXI39594.1 hypothetical protein CP963_09665 [Arcobacter cloacae]
MNNLEIQTYLKRNRELFIKIDMDYIINNSSKIMVHDIYDLKFNNEVFKINEISDYEYYSIFVVILNKRNDKILETRVFTKHFKSDEINFNIIGIENKEVLEEYYFLISVLPIIKEKEGLLSNLIKIFYNPEIGKSKNFILNNKLEIISTIILIFSLSFSLLQINIINKLIDNYGFVDNLLNNLSISNSIILYFYEDFFLKIGSILLILILFSLLSIFLLNFFMFFFISCKLILEKIIFCNENNLHTKIELMKISLNMKANIKAIFYDINFLIYSIFTVFLLTLLIFTPLFSIVSEANIKNNLNLTGKIIEKYFEFSKFPAFVKIKELNIDEKDVLLIGYDNTYTYYYDKKYIDEELMKKFIKFNNDEYDSREMPFSEIYSYYLKDVLSKEKLKLIRNIDYKIKDELKSNYFEIIKKKKNE